MNFEFTEEQELVREEARKFLSAELQPYDDEYGDREMTSELAKQLLEMLREMDWMGPDAPHDPVVRGILEEELGRVFPGLAGIWFIASTSAMALAAGAHPDVAARLAPGMLNGELIGSFGISEPNVGSDPSAIECRAELRGDHYVVNGAKSWISNGHIADVVLLMCRTDPEEGRQGIRQIVVDRSESPFESRDTPTLGMRSFPTSELYFDDVKVPAINRVGGWGDETARARRDSGEALANTLRGFYGARVSSAFIALGIAQRAFDIASEYVKQRKQFGKEIGRFQLVQQMIADMYTELELARLITYRARLNLGGPRSAIDASMSKAYATEAGLRIASTAIQCMGSNGLAIENRVERCLRDARMWTMPDGTTQIQKLIMGRELLGMSALR